VIERGNGGKHPLIGNVFKFVAMLLRGLLTDLLVHVAHFGLMRFGHGLPGFEKGREADLDALVGVGDAGFDHTVHGFLEAVEKGFLLSGEFVGEFRARGLQLSARVGGAAPKLFTEAIEFVAGGALNFVDESCGGGVRGFGEKGLRTFEGLAKNLFHLRLRVADKAAAGVIEFAGEDAGNFSGLFAEMIGGLLDDFFGGVLDLCLRFFLVPLGGLHQVFDGAMLGVGNFFFEFGEVARGDALRRVLQDLFDAAEIWRAIRRKLRRRRRECGLVGV
jgi:hypothetical protein